MIKHYIDWITNTYIVEENDKVVLSINLDREKDQIIIKTPKEVYAGPVDLISFEPNLSLDKK